MMGIHDFVGVDSSDSAVHNLNLRLDLHMVVVVDSSEMMEEQGTLLRMLLDNLEEAEVHNLE